MHILRTRLLLLLTVVSLAAAHGTATAQEYQPRFGLGFNTMVSSAEESVLGFGLRGRVSFPYNQDLSFAASASMTGFVLSGYADGSIVFDPQLSAIITLPGQGRLATYFLGGIGTYLSSGDDDTTDNGTGTPDTTSPDESGANGFTLHIGIGRVRLLNETTIFYEVNPMLIIRRTSVGAAVPVRVGFIF